MHGAEALLRWNHPVHRIDSAGGVHPIAEESGLSAHWRLGGARGVPAGARLASAGLPPLRVAVICRLAVPPGQTSSRC